MTPIDLSSCTVRPTEGFYTSQVPASQSWPLLTFLPTGYEANYPYPLLVFLHGHGGSEQQVLQMAPQLSRRNYICIALRGPHTMDPRPDGRPAFTWGRDCCNDTGIEDYVLHAVQQTRRNYHIHTERIYLAGFCEGATLAYSLALSMPQRFAGIISLNGTMPGRGGPLLRMDEVRHLRVLIGHGIANSVIPLSLARNDCRVLYSAGMSVRMKTYPVNHRIHPDMLRDINHWIMQKIHEEQDALAI
jgi:phospholipase/carboxylesterase